MGHFLLIIVLILLFFLFNYIIFKTPSMDEKEDKIVNEMNKKDSKAD